MQKGVVLEGQVKDFKDFDVYAFMGGVQKKVVNTIDDYEKKMQGNVVFTMNFPCVDIDGNLYVYESGIRIQMDNKEIDGFGYNPQYRSDKLLESYTVVVTSVDKKTNLVKVSSHKAKEEPRKKLEAALAKGIETKEYLRVPAIVVKLVGNGSVALINIGGLGIAGAVRLGEWSTAFTKKFYNVAHIGAEIEVVVMGYGKWESGKVFDCSRRLTIDFDPWKDIEKRLPQRAGVKFTCVSKEDRNFFSVIDGVQELNAYCEYPDPESGIEIAEGIEYLGYVAKVNEKTKLLRVKVLKQV